MTTPHAPAQKSQLNILGIILAILAAIVLAAALVAVGPRRITPSKDLEGDPKVAQIVADTAKPGHNKITAAVVKKDGSIYGGIGATKNDVVEIGSVTKTMTAEVLRGMVDDGQVSLDTTVAEILPEATGSEVADVTLKELATHTSGLPRLGGVNTAKSLLHPITGASPYHSTQQDIFDAATDAHLKDRGTKKYSNLGFSLLGHLLAKKAGKPYEELLSTYVFEPASMKTAFLMGPDSDPEKMTKGLLNNGFPADPWASEGDAPAGEVRASAEDMAAYSQHLLETGLPDYTWIDLEDGTAARWHNGGTGGYRTFLVIDPDKDIAVFANGNTTSDVEDTAMALLDATRKGEI